MGDFDAAWRAAFNDALDDTSFDSAGDGPLWSLTLLAPSTGEKSALLYAANHAVSDQLSHQSVLHDILRLCAARRAGDAAEPPLPLPLPPSVEGALLGEEDRQTSEIKERLELLKERATFSTLKYAAFQLGAGGAVVLPQQVPPPDAIDERWSSARRRTRALFERLDASATAALRAECKRRGLTVSAALCAATLVVTAECMQAAGAREAAQPGAEPTAKYKLLQALNMRPYGADGARGDWSGGTVVAGTGSLDIVVDLPPDAASRVLDSPAGAGEDFWECAAACSRQTRGWVEQGFPRESLLLFSAGWEFMNMNRIVELSAQDRSTLGRAYSCGNSNVGVYPHDAQYGDMKLRAIYFGISNTVSGTGISVSSVTVDGALGLSVQFCEPIWEQSDAARYAETMRQVLLKVAGA